MTQVALVPTRQSDAIITDKKPPASESYSRPSDGEEAQRSSSARSAPNVTAPRVPNDVITFPLGERLLSAREVAQRLGVSERWVRDHTTRRSPKIRAVKLGPLVRYRREDVEQFMESLSTPRPYSQPR